MPAPPAEPIASEAQVFRTRLDMMAIAFAARREREAHPRTLRTMRYLRAYPGAPPRIPHELTPDEFRAGACNTCHERGGYSRRFEAYVPVTPHPGNGLCLQCHVGADEVMAVPLVGPDANRRCRQCHGAGGKPRADADISLDWRTMAWPQPAPTTPGRTLPPIPHDLQSRGNCVACHAGPAAVAEIRTAHPEWANCRQCHVAPDPEAEVFTRAARAGGDGTGGGS
jgi:cytochrome c-type protein NapB